MSKREMLHTLLDKLLDIEETSKKGVRFNYSNDLLTSYFKECAEKGGDEVGKSSFVFFKTRPDETYAEALENFEFVANSPDVEPKISVLLTLEKARELGLAV